MSWISKILKLWRHAESSYEVAFKKVVSLLIFKTLLNWKNLKIDHLIKLSRNRINSNFEAYFLQHLKLDITAVEGTTQKLRNVNVIHYRCFSTILQSNIIGSFRHRTEHKKNKNHSLLRFFYKVDPDKNHVRSTVQLYFGQEWQKKSISITIYKF